MVAWLRLPSLFGLPLVPVPLASSGAVLSFVPLVAWPFGSAGAASALPWGWPVLLVCCFPPAFWGWLRFRAFVGLFASLVGLRGLLLLLLPLRPAFVCALSTWGQFTSQSSHTERPGHRSFLSKCYRICAARLCNGCAVHAGKQRGAGRHVVGQLGRAGGKVGTMFGKTLEFLKPTGSEKNQTSAIVIVHFFFSKFWD